MNMRLRTLTIFVCFFFACACLWAQQEAETSVSDETAVSETGRKYKPRKQNLLIDIPMTIGEITLINLAGNMYWRLWGPDSEAAYFTADSIRSNLNPGVWSFEIGQGGDTFLVNQFFHPYAGSLYFASARSNNFNFYWSILSSIFGSVYWETLGETDTPSISDLINTTFGGIALGEILHRLYIELDKGRLAAKIGATILSPTDRITAAVRGYGPEKDPGKISVSSLALGFSWINAKFFDDNDEVTSWNKPSAFINYDLVYGDPYTAHSKTPFDQFDLCTSFTLSFPLVYNFVFIADGYLASWLLTDDDADQASSGITLNFDIFVTDKGFMDLNNGRENLSFNANSLDYSIKWRRQGQNQELYILNKPFSFSMKTHLGFSPWVVTDYNGGLNKDDYNLYLFGGNIKLFMELRQINEDGGAKNGHVLSFSLCFFDTWNIPNTPGFDVNTLFIFSKIAYSFPFTNRFSFYIADSFLFLHCHLTRDVGTAFPDITRWYNGAQAGIKISFRS